MDNEFNLEGQQRLQSELDYLSDQDMENLGYVWKAI